MSAQYRVWIDGKPAVRAQYDRLETVVVEQGMGMATEARLEFEACIDDKGVWKNGPSDPVARAWKRVRIEVRHGGGAWTPLIDGPIIAWNASMSGEPGHSMLTVTVHDDGALLNRKPAKMDIKWEGKSDADIMRSLLQGYEVHIDDLPITPSDIPVQFMQNGSPMEILLTIAQRHGVDLYVKPGEREGWPSHVIVERRNPKKFPELPNLVLTGPKRNLDSFDARSDSLFGNQFKGSRLNLRDMAVVSHTTSWKDVSLLGDKSAIDDPEILGYDLLDPVDAASYDHIERAEEAQQWISFQTTASGTIRSGCYDGVLAPYETILVVGVSSLSTKYMISEVTHTLGRSSYEQSFTLIGNARVELDENGFPVTNLPPATVQQR
ncbi:MAG: hypothetical protein AB7T06_10455 [Kofleriaceae bacterium]